jgi:hypothetical protein
MSMEVLILESSKFVNPEIRDNADFWCIASVLVTDKKLEELLSHYDWKLKIV